MLQLLCRCYPSCRPRLCRVSPRHPAMDSTIRYTLSLMERKHLHVRHGPGTVKRSTNSVVLSLNTRGCLPVAGGHPRPPLDAGRVPNVRVAPSHVTPAPPSASSGQRLPIMAVILHGEGGTDFQQGSRVNKLIIKLNKELKFNCISFVEFVNSLLTLIIRFAERVRSLHGLN